MYTATNLTRMLAIVIEQSKMGLKGGLFDVNFGPLENQLTIRPKLRGQKFIIEINELVDHDIIAQDILDDVEEERGDFR